jgi:hypothetical protein
MITLKFRDQQIETRDPVSHASMYSRKHSLLPAIANNLVSGMFPDAAAGTSSRKTNFKKCRFVSILFFGLCSLRSALD